MIFADPPEEAEPTQAEIDAELEIDAIAARDRDDDVRVETGYSGPAPLVLESPSARCVVCGVNPAIVWMPGERERTACGECQGKANRVIVDELADAVRTLKTSDDGEAMSRATARLIVEYGRAEARDKIDFIARCRAEGKYKPKQQRGERTT